MITLTIKIPGDRQITVKIYDWFLAVRSGAAGVAQLAQNLNKNQGNKPFANINFNYFLNYLFLFHLFHMAQSCEKLIKFYNKKHLLFFFS